MQEKGLPASDAIQSPSKKGMDCYLITFERQFSKTIRCNNLYIAYIYFK